MQPKKNGCYKRCGKLLSSTTSQRGADTDPFAELVMKLEEIAPLAAAQKRLLQVVGRELFLEGLRGGCLKTKD